MFSPALEKIWAASLEDTPFNSIRGDLDPARNSWGAKVQLFSSKECSLNKSGLPKDHWMYYCVIRLAEFAERRKGNVAPGGTWLERVKPFYVNLVNLVQASRTNWNINPVPLHDSALTFTVKNDVLKGYAIPRSIEVRLEPSALILTVKPPHE